jgi:hypothetical protein
MSLKFEIPAITDPTKFLADSTKKQYARHLNHLAQRGFPTIEAIRKNIFGVVRTITALAPGDEEETKAKRRMYMSAIFWVYPALKAQKFNPLKNLWERSLPATSATTGEPWVTRKDYIE